MIETSALEKTPKYNLIVKVGNEYFTDACQKELLFDMVKVFNQSQSVYVKIDRYRMLVDNERQFAMSGEFGRILDYFSLIHNFAGFRASVNCGLLDAYDYQLGMHKLRLSGATQYPLNPLIWQIYSEILPKQFQTKSHQLKLKVKFMPNFSSIGAVPNYLHPVMASCLTGAKSVQELLEMFDGVSEEEINRVFLLCILTDVADMQVIEESFKSSQQLEQMLNIDSHQQKQQTKEVQRAAKTGFFKRLLKKLSWS